MGRRMVDMAEAYTRYPGATVSIDNGSTSNERHETDTIESVPSLEPRDEDEEEDESVSLCNSQDEIFP